MNLKISELKSPARIIETAQKDLNMKISASIRVMEVSGYSLGREEKIYDYIVKNHVPEIKNYDTFLGTIYSIKDIVMVVSEGVLTFFIT